MFTWKEDKHKIKIAHNEQTEYTPKFDFDINAIPFLVKIEKTCVGGTTHVHFRTSGDIPVRGMLCESLKNNGEWGYTDFHLQLVGRDGERDYSLVFEVGDNAINYYFDIKKILVAFQKLGFQTDTTNCKMYIRLAEMVEKSNNLLYLETVQKMRENGEQV